MRKRLTFSNVVAFLALFVSLSAGSYAAIKLPANSVSSKQIKANAVTTPKIKSGAVTAPKIKAGAIESAQVKDGALTGADMNLATLGKVPSAAAADAAPIAKVQIVTADGANAPAGSSVNIAAATATCPAGMFVTGGGLHVTDSSSQAANDTHPSGNNAWIGEVWNAGGGSPGFTVYAVCATAAATG